jgi:hypothetical protein
MKRAPLVCFAALLLAASPVACGASLAARQVQHFLESAVGRNWPQGDPDIVVRAILAQPAYRSAAPTNAHLPEPTMWDRLRYWLGERMRDILVRLAYFFQGTRGAGKTAAVLVLIVAAASVLLLLVRLITRSLNRSRAVQASLSKQEATAVRGGGAWHALSLEAASQGRYGEAVSALFMAALRLLDERRILAFDAARTPNEYRLRIAGALAAASPAFDHLASCFVGATYARTAPERVVYDTAARAYGVFVSELPVS